ncbi:MAG: DUF4389 domain-containing protein [Chloroflexi bacterium]|nr:DUF4389 domain-containing protein [Chloroflexota bacterium]MCY4111000.1 DUF4389 domain-containing protein [Chloroflexota bacterium]
MVNPSPYPVNITAEYPERSSRLLAFCGLTFLIKGLLLLPHLIVLYFLSIVAVLAQLVGYVAIIITGWYPRGLFDFQVGVLRWNLRTSAWFLSIVDEYPPFRLQD